MAITDIRDTAAYISLMPLTSNITDVQEFFSTYHDRIYRYVLRIVKHRAEAEDLTQETFMRAFRSHDSLRDPDAVGGWLYRIATHVCLDRLRQRRAEVSMNEKEQVPALERIASTAATGLQLAERKETSACVQRCLEYLPEQYRAVLLLHLGHSLTADEIADLLGLKLTTVKMRLHRARVKLTQVMECGCTVSSDERGLPICQPKP